MLHPRIKLWSLWRFPTVNASPSVPDAETTAPTAMVGAVLCCLPRSISSAKF